jgi:hypothetical protein
VPAPPDHRWQLDERVELRKAHPCGSREWVITRTGIDIGLRCVGCGHRIMLPRDKFLRAVRKIIPPSFPGE